MNLTIFETFYRPSPINDNDDDNSSESGSEGSSSVDTSSDDGSKIEPIIENWGLSEFLKPDKPVPQVKTEPSGDSTKNSSASNDSATTTKKSLPKTSPKCLNDDKIKQEPIGKKFYFYFSPYSFSSIPLLENQTIPLEIIFIFFFLFQISFCFNRTEKIPKLLLSL